MSIRKSLTAVGAAIILILCMTTIHSSDEDTLDVFFNDMLIEEGCSTKDYLSSLKVSILSHDEELLDAIQIKVLKNEEPLPLDIKKDIQNGSLQFILTEGERYEILIGVDMPHVHIQKRITDITVHGQVPILLNDEKLPQISKTTDNLIFKLDSLTYLDMSRSFIIKNGSKEVWKMIEDQYVFTIDQTGEYDLEFHFYDVSGGKSIQYAQLMKEQQDKILQVQVEEPFSKKDATWYYHENIHLNLNTNVVDITALEIYVNDQKLSSEWLQQANGYQTTIPITSEGIYQLECRYEGETVSSVLTDQILVLDKTPPKVFINFIKQEYYADSVTIMATVQEDNFSYGADLQEMYEGQILHHTSWQQKGNTYYQAFALDDEGVHTLALNCFDLAGNEAILIVNDEEVSSDTSLWIPIDKTSPSIVDITEYPQHNPAAEKFIMHLQIHDPYLDLEKTSIILQKDGVEYAEFASTWDDHMLDLQLPLTDDGSYCYFIKAVDKAGNKSEQSCEVPFVIDQTKPIVELQNSTLLQNTNQSVKIKFHVQDLNLQQYRLSIMRNGIEQEVITGCDPISKTLTFQEDAGTNVYEMQAWAIDQAGNESSSNKLQFVIDKEAPQIYSYLQGISAVNKLLTNQSVQMKFEWQDAFFNRGEIAIYKNGILEDTLMFDHEEGFYKFIKALQGHIDEYEYRLFVYDIAGNMSEASLSFIIDTFLPKLHISNDIFKGKAINHSWTPKLEEMDKEVFIQDTTLMKNQKAVYYEWGTPISEEGNYRLTVTAKDEAGNLTDLEQPFYFTIDKTPPDIQLFNTDTGETIEQYAEGNGVLHLKADAGLFYMDVLTSLKIDGKQLLQEETSQFEWELKEPGTYQISISARDEAGNITDKSYQCQIFEKPVKSSHPWIFKIVVLFVFSICLHYKKVCRF